MIPVLNIIHLPKELFPTSSDLYLESIRREQNFKAQAFQAKITYGIWDGQIVKGLPHTGISRSHKQIIQHAKDNQLDLCFIAEDDFKLTSPGSWQYFTDNIPDDFDLYMAGISGGLIDEKTHTVDKFTGLFLYAISARFYDVFLSAPEDFNIDCWLSRTGIPEIENKLGRKPIYKVCYPIASITNNGVSYKSETYVHHERFFKAYQQYQ